MASQNGKMRICKRCNVPKEEEDFLSIRGLILKSCSRCREKNKDWYESKKEQPKEVEEKTSQICIVCQEEKPKEFFLTNRNRRTKRCRECIEKSKN